MADEINAPRGDRVATWPQALIERRSGTSAGPLGDLVQP
jgi:hypothetical protein